MTHCINYKFMYLSAYWLWKWANNRNKISAALQIMLRARLDNQQSTVSPRIDHQSWTFAKKKFCFDLFARHWLLPQTLHTYTSCLCLVRNGALQIFYSRSEIVRRLVMPHELILGFFLHHICSRQIFCLSSCVTRWRSTDTSISVMAFEHPLTPSPTSMIDTQWRHSLGTDSRLLIILDCTQTYVAVLLRFKTFSICYGFGLSNVNWIPSIEDISLSHKNSRKSSGP